MESSTGRWARFVRRRRRTIVSLVLAFVALGAAVWWMTHRRDARLEGRWLFTHGVVPTAEELKWPPDRNRAVDRVEWIFESDGSGESHSKQWNGPARFLGYEEFTWWTDGDERLCIEWGEPVRGWAAIKRMVFGTRRLIAGATVPIPEEYDYVAGDESNGAPSQFVLRFVNSEEVQQDGVYYLTRIEE